MFCKGRPRWIAGKEGEKETLMTIGREDTLDE